MKNAILKTQKLCKTFSSGGMQQHILKNLDVEILGGDFTVIMGASGAGKSTLLYALSGMDTPTLGEIYFGDVELSKLSGDKLAVFRRDNCGFVFQQMYLLDNMSVLDNVIVCGLLANSNRNLVVKKAKSLLTKLHIDEAAWRKFPTQISGGEAQRVAIARALINNPKIVFADEPTGALNSAFSKAVLDSLTDVNEQGQSIIMVTHDLKSALRGNRIIYLMDGIIKGELQLEKFSEQGAESAKRHDKLNAFLLEMGW
ncbi:ABC transporter ATP-binding protein [Clostridia bacterium]|nr:ABC transporter ATP-binding protein [Clostridia bacterium]